MINSSFTERFEQQPEQQQQIDRIQEVRKAKIQKLKSIASKLGINLENLSESQLDQLLEAIDHNSFQLLQKLSQGLYQMDQQAASTLQNMITAGDFDQALAFLQNLHNQQSSALTQLDNNFQQASQQITEQTIQNFVQNIQADDNPQTLLGNNLDYNILRASYIAEKQNLTIYADISKIEGYQIIGYSISISGNGIEDLLPTHGSQKEFFNNKFIIYKHSNQAIISPDDFTFSILKILGNPTDITISDIKIRISTGEQTKEIYLSDLKVL